MNENKPPECFVAMWFGSKLDFVQNEVGQCV